MVEIITKQSAMSDKTREDFERWAASKEYRIVEIAWQAYQQGIADARKESTETAAEWIGRHLSQYEVASECGSDAHYVSFLKLPGNGKVYAYLRNEDSRRSVCVNLTTASDCINLCEILRVTPVEMVVGT